MKNNFFKVGHRSTKSKARLGEIRTAHGIIKTPAFVPCATKGTLKTMIPSLIKDIGTQMAFVNTYHLVTHPGAEIIAAAGGIHEFAKLNMPLMSDSGGFQIFSLGKKTQNSPLRPSTSSFDSPCSLRTSLRTSEGQANIKTNNKSRNQNESDDIPLLIKVAEDGVKLRSTFDGQLFDFTPEFSITSQIKIGADIMISLDECTYYPATHKYAERAMERTHGWLLRCIDTKHLTLDTKQTYQRYLYGVIQGATFEDLRKKSAEFVCSQNTDGVAIGGVSVGETKQAMRDQVRWVSSYLPADRPVHLLGVGQFDDIVDLVRYGIDTFDCVEPTRLARVGYIFSWQQILPRLSLPPSLKLRKAEPVSTIENPSARVTCCQQKTDYGIDINKSIYKADLSSVDEGCDCYVCQNFTKAYLHHLFKQREILGYSLATYHNLYVMERFFEKIRELIKNNLI